jgi:DNA transposition AAA+ family ATPase
LTHFQVSYTLHTMARKRVKLTDQLRQAIENCGKSRYQISRDAGIDQATLSRFMHGKGGLSMPILDTLGDYLELNIAVRRRRRKAKKE